MFAIEVHKSKAILFKSQMTIFRLLESKVKSKIRNESWRVTFEVADLEWLDFSSVVESVCNRKWFKLDNQKFHGSFNRKGFASSRNFNGTWTKRLELTRNQRGVECSRLESKVGTMVLKVKDWNRMLWIQIKSLQSRFLLVFAWVEHILGSLVERKTTWSQKRIIIGVVCSKSLWVERIRSWKYFGVNGRKQLAWSRMWMLIWVEHWSFIWKISHKVLIVLVFLA